MEPTDIMMEDTSIPSDIYDSESESLDDYDQPMDTVEEQRELVTLMTMMRQGENYVLEPSAEYIATLATPANNSQPEDELNESTDDTNAAQDPEGNDITDHPIRPESIARENRRMSEIINKFVTRNDGDNRVVKKRTKTYRNYSEKQLSDFIDMIIEMKPVKEAANKAGLALSTAYRIRDFWNSKGCLPERQPRGPKKAIEFNERHLLYLIKLVDKTAHITLSQMFEKLSRKFPGEITMSRSAFYRFVREYCALTIKKLNKFPEYRTLDETIKKRKEAVDSWLKDKNMDFEKNCVFVDESGFNLYISRGKGWSVKGEPSIAHVPRAKGTNISLIGAIFHGGIINLMLRKSTALTGASKKRDVNGKPIKVSKGTTKGHFMGFLNVLMDILDANNLKGYYIIMDNCSIHSGEELSAYIEGRGYKAVYLPSYSPFLNPIEEFWSKLKYGVKRNAFESRDSLTPRIIESCSHITVKDCQNWIQHSVSFFPHCQNEVRIL